MFSLNINLEAHRLEELLTSIFKTLNYEEFLEFRKGWNRVLLELLGEKLAKDYLLPVVSLEQFAKAQADRGPFLLCRSGAPKECHVCQGRFELVHNFCPICGTELSLVEEVEPDTQIIEKRTNLAIAAHDLLDGFLAGKFRTPVLEVILAKLDYKGIKHGFRDCVFEGPVKRLEHIQKYLAEKGVQSALGYEFHKAA